MKQTEELIIVDNEDLPQFESNIKRECDDIEMSKILIQQIEISKRQKEDQEVMAESKSFTNKVKEIKDDSNRSMGGGNFSFINHSHSRFGDDSKIASECGDVNKSNNDDVNNKSVVYIEKAQDLMLKDLKIEDLECYKLSIRKYYMNNHDMIKKGLQEVGSDYYKHDNDELIVTSEEFDGDSGKDDSLYGKFSKLVSGRADPRFLSKD